MERSFACATRPDRLLLLEEVLGKDGDSNAPIVAMVKDPYANYVIQKMIDVLDEEERAVVLQRIKRHVPSMRKVQFGKHIISKVEKLTGSQL